MKLELLVRDSKIQVKHALDEVFNLAKHSCVGYLGAWTSATTKKVSELLSIPSIDRSIIAHSATSPELSESRFSNVLRTKPADDIAAKLMTQLMKGRSVGWLVHCTCSTVLSAKWSVRVHDEQSQLDSGNK